MKRDTRCFCNVRYRRNGNRQLAMLRFYKARAFVEPCNDAVLYTKVIGKNGYRQDIDDGINGTHFVEMNFFYGNAVSLRLGFGNDAENLFRG